MNHAGILVPFLVLALSSAESGAEPEASGDASKVAKESVALASRLDPQELAARFHYPPSYTEDERVKDTSAVSSDLAFLFEQLGKPENVQPHREAVTFYGVGLSGGTIPYWEKLAPFNSYQFTYSAQFAKAGPGFLSLQIFRHADNEAFEIARFNFGLPATSAGKARAIDLMLALSARSGAPMPPNFKELLEEQLKPAHLPAQEGP